MNPIRNETAGSKRFRRLSAVTGLGGVMVAVVAAILGLGTITGVGLLVFGVVPMLAFVGHLNSTDCLSSEQKAIWRKELWWSHRSFLAVWAYLFARDLVERTRGFAPGC